MPCEVKIIKRRLSWQKIDKELSLQREFKDLHMTFGEGDVNLCCGLSVGRCHRRIYCRHEEPMGSQIIHIWRHTDGICIRPALTVESDISLMNEAYRKLTTF